MNSGNKHILPIGTILNGKYKILQVIGAGGFGITYKAQHTYLPEMRVVKEFFLDGKCVRANDSLDVQTQSLSQAEFERFKARFLEEAKILSKLKNVPHTIEVTDFFEENKTAYLVMPFVEAEDLQKYLHRQPQSRISEHEALTYFAQIATALGEIHKENIIHRDLKPANILIGKKGFAYLIDFGAAREFIAEGLTKTMTAILTPGYAPLEQYDEQAKRFATTDIYAMGALLYRMLTGKNPINAISRLSAELPTPHSLVPTISAHISDAIMKAMEMKPEDRFQSAKEMMDALQGTLVAKPQPNVEETDWDKATQQDTIGAYQTFLLKYPQSHFKGIAESRIKALQPKTQTITIEKPAPKPAEPSKVRRVSDNDFAAFWGKYKIHTLLGLALLLVIFFVPKLLNHNNNPITPIKAEVTPSSITTSSKSDYTETINGVSFVMKAIPGRSFYMGETEVTQALWQAVMGNNPSKFQGCSQCPVEMVSWDDVQNFIKELNKKTGKSYRLPKEYEWEYTAKAEQNYEYAGSNNIDEVAWYSNNSGNTAHAIKQKKANGYGLYDMSGNVWEWCEDLYNSNDLSHVVRGGAWHYFAPYCNISYRNYYGQTNRLKYIGFRLACLP